MKKLFALITLVTFLSIGMVNTTFAQKAKKDEVKTDAKTEVAANDTTQKVADTNAVAATDTAAAPIADEEVVKEETFNQILKRYFIEGDARFMVWVLLCLIFGLAMVIERVIYLNMATTNTKKLMAKIEENVKSNNIEAAKNICRDTRGPAASIFYQGLLRFGDGESLDNVEKSIVSYGSVQMARLEKGLSWISLFIALAPMLGFLGTVVGMIQAFDKIQEAGDISPTIVAGGIKVALLTTVFGLVVAIILQIFYNYLIAKIDDLVNDMEDSSISFMDILASKSAK